MKKKVWLTKLACVGLVAAVIAGAAIAVGTQGSQADPLVTLSYLNKVAVPQIMEQVEQMVKEHTEKAEKELGSAEAAFQSLELKEGQTLHPSAGCQVLIRSGELRSTDALVDLTTGETWVNDGSLRRDHLYIATGEEQEITAAEKSLVMIQGSWKVE